MNNFKKLICVALCVALVLAFAGCEPKVLGGGSSDTPNNDVVVATVNGEAITYGEYYELISYYTSMYYMTPEDIDDSLGVETANSFRDEIIDELVSTKVMLQKAKEKGLDQLTEEETTEIQTTVDEYFESVTSYYLTEVQDEQSALTESDAEATVLTDEQMQTEAQKRADEYLAEKGYTKEYVKSRFIDSAIQDKLYNSVIAEAAVSDAEIQKYYDEQLAAQKADENAISNYAEGNNDVNLYIPGGIKYVKQILVGISDEVSEQISALETEDEQNTATEKALTDIKPTAEEALAKVKAGEDFDSLIAKYGSDTGMTTEPYATTGYPVYEGAGYVEEFSAAASALKNVGDTTELIGTYMGWHIIKLLSVTEEGAVPLADVKDDIKKLVLADGQSELWNTTLQQWIAEAEVVKNTESYYSVAKPAATGETTEPVETPDPEVSDEPAITDEPLDEPAASIEPTPEATK